MSLHIFICTHHFYIPLHSHDNIYSISQTLPFTPPSPPDSPQPSFKVHTLRNSTRISQTLLSPSRSPPYLMSHQLGLELPPPFTTKLYTVDLPLSHKPQLSASLEFTPQTPSPIDYTTPGALEAVFSSIALPSEQFYTALNFSLSEAAAHLAAGNTISFPTETVYGLGANACDTEAVSKIYAAKGRPSDNPLIVHIATLAQLQDLTPAPISPLALALIHHFWPGPLSIILPHKNTVSPKVTAGLNTLAIRMPSHPLALGLIKLSGCPIAAPSSNTSGKPSPTEASHVMFDLNGKIPGIVDGQVRLFDENHPENNEIINLDCAFGLESTVVDISHVPYDFDWTSVFFSERTSIDSSAPKQPLIYILRPGAITKQMLEGVVGAGYVEYDPALLINIESFDDHPSISINDSDGHHGDDNIDGKYTQYDTKHHDLQPKSPGMKYTHYAPKAPLYIAKNLSSLTANLLASIQKQSTLDHQYTGDNKNTNKIGLLCTTEMLNDIKHELLQEYSQKSPNNPQNISQVDEFFEKYVIVKTCGSKDNMYTIATKLYKCLRDFDQIEQVGIIYAELLSHNNLGAAIMDRLLKAAGGRLLR